MPGTCAIVGIGGLGAPAAALLATQANITLKLIDDDVVDLSNLHRQPLFGVSDIGKKKAVIAARRLLDAHAKAEIEMVTERLTPATAPQLLRNVTWVLDGSDNLATKLFLNEWSCATRTPLVHAGALGVEGQLISILPGQSACLRCLFIDLPVDEDLPTCQQEGVLGPVVGAIGLAAAREISFLLRGEKPPLLGRFAILDGRTLRWRALETRRRPECLTCGGLA